MADGRVFTEEELELIEEALYLLAEDSDTTAQRREVASIISKVEGLLE